MLRTLTLLIALTWAMLTSAMSIKQIEATLEKAYDAEDAGQFDKAIAIYTKCLDELPADSVAWQSDICSSLLNCHFRLGQLYKATAYGERGLLIDERQGDKMRISSSMSNLASILIAANRLERAEEYLLRSVALERELKDDASLAIRLGMLAEVYIRMKKQEKALPLAREALELDRRGGREKKMAIRMSQYASALVGLGRINQAMPYLADALRLHRKHENIPSIAITLVTLGEAEHRLHHDDEARRHLTECIRLSESTGLVQQLMAAHLELSHQYGENNDPQAYGHLVRYNELKDSLNTLQVQQQLSDLEVRYETKQKEQELKSKEQLIERQRIIYIALAMATIMLIGLVVFLAKSIRLKNQNMQLKDRFMQIISHDLKNPALAQQKCTRMLVKAIGVMPDSEVRTMAIRMSEYADDHIALLYSLLDWAGLQTGRLRYTPIRFDLTSVAADVAAQHRAQAEIKGTNLILTADKEDHTVTADRQMTEAMMRNLVSNAIKFSSEGCNITISINGTTAVITDEGIGLGTESHDKGTGIGLTLVRRFAEINKATFCIKRRQPQGSTASIVFQIG